MEIALGADWRFGTPPSAYAGFWNGDYLRRRFDQIRYLNALRGNCGMLGNWSAKAVSHTAVHPTWLLCRKRANLVTIEKRTVRNSRAGG